MEPRKIVRDHYRFWPKGSKVQFKSGIDTSVGTIIDARPHKKQFWHDEFLVEVSQWGKFGGEPRQDWVISTELQFADPWREYERQLGGHDWTFEMSDDGRVWEKGIVERDKLKALKAKLVELDKEKATSLWAEHEKKGWGR